MSIAALRQQLAEIVQGARPALPGLPTGFAALDAALPEHGLPRGRLTEITGAPGSGRTTFARQLGSAALRTGWWVAYVDAARTLAPRDWAALGTYDGLWVVRPDNPTRGAWCADVLLRSGAFGLVILDGAPALSREIAVRLVRLARASDAALVLLTPDGQHAGIAGALQLRVQRASAKRKTEPIDLTARREGKLLASPSPPTRISARRLVISIEKGGPAQRLEVDCAGDGTQYGSDHATHGNAHRVREDPQVPDRRGVARRDKHKRGARAGGAGERAFRAPRRSDAALGRTAARPA